MFSEFSCPFYMLFPFPAFPHGFGSLSSVMSHSGLPPCPHMPWATDISAPVPENDHNRTVGKWTKIEMKYCGNCYYGLNCVHPTPLVCWSPNPQSPAMQPYLEMGHCKCNYSSENEVLVESGGPPIQYDSCSLFL